MPNWIGGDLKVRGIQKDIKKFILEGLSPVDYTGKVINKYSVVSESWELSVNIDKGLIFYINDTRRHFIDSNNITVYFNGEEDDKEIVVLENFKAAWGINVEELSTISKKYNIDFKILGFEAGMEFNQDVEIVNGKVIINEEVNFKDYRWDCVRPHIGG